MSSSNMNLGRAFRLTPIQRTMFWWLNLLREEGTNRGIGAGKDPSGPSGGSHIKSTRWPLKYSTDRIGVFECECECVCVHVSERERMFVCLCELEGANMCVCACVL